jgi:large subunit ribosomal protein L25
MISLKANKRDEKTSVESIRNEGLVPCVVYGPKQETVHFTVKEADFKKVYEDAGESTMVSVVVDGDEIDTLIHDIQLDPVKGMVMHVDFYAVERGKKLQVSVELIFEGVSPAEKNLSALITKVMHEVEVECLPRDLPSDLKVDLEQLTDLDSQILAKDIKLPEGVELVADSEEVVAAVREAKEEVIEEETEAPDMDSIEVEQKGKGEEESTEEAK